MKKTLLIYHFEDNDGVCSAAIMLHYLVNEMHIDKKDVELFGVNYNMLAALPDTWFDEAVEKYDRVIMTDISFNDPNRMLKLKELFGSNFVWVDHHAPIIKESYRLEFDDVNGLRDTKHSAIVNMWRYLYDPLKTEKIPLLFQYLSGWDSFSWKQYDMSFNDVRYVNKAYTKESQLNVDFYYNNMSKYLVNNRVHLAVFKEISDMYRIGKRMCDKEDQYYKEMIDNVGDKEWVVDGNRKTVMVVLYGGSSSLMFQSLQDTEYKNGLVFRRYADGKWGISLYNINVEDTFDCGAYLKERYNGGGHKGAAGACITEEQFVNILKTKSL